MTSCSFIGEPLDARLLQAVFGATREADSVPFSPSAVNLVGIFQLGLSSGQATVLIERLDRAFRTACNTRCK